jgi:mediator of RNA polymerase II transcription subunit 14
MDQDAAVNGSLHETSNGLMHSPSQEELERELPSVMNGQVPLAELVSRMAQAIYAELTELAET